MESAKCLAIAMPMPSPMPVAAPPSAGLLAAARIAPAVRDYCIFCHRSAEPGHLAQIRDLGGEPLLDLGLRLGEGTGAAIAYPLVCSGLAFLNERASFEAAGVSNRDN
jgi:nicotinate-nucleotide--dimethylbenzimidazole phosphoribosyltransferase